MATVAALTLRAFVEIAAQVASVVHGETLAPIVAHESGFEPYAVGVNRPCDPRLGGIYPTRSAAEGAVRRLLAMGCTSLDLGVAQINTAADHMQKRGLAVTDAFDPRIGIKVGGEVLLACWYASAGYGDEQRRLRAAVGCYNRGVPDPDWPYVTKVQARAEIIVPALRTAAGPAPDAPVAPVVAQPAPEPSCAPTFDSWALALCQERQARARRRQDPQPADPPIPSPDMEEYP